MALIGTLSELTVQPRTQAELVTSRESWVLSETEACRRQLIRNSDAKGELSSSGLTLRRCFVCLPVLSVVLFCILNL